MKSPPEALLTEKGEEVWFMLQYALQGDTSQARKLLDNNEGLAACSWGYVTPLHLAVREGHAAFVELLIDHGANPTEKWLGWQDLPLTVARDRGHRDIEELLTAYLKRTFRTSAEGESIGRCIREGRVEEALRLLDDGPALIHAGDERGNTPIHWAVLTRRRELIDELLRRGADLNAKRADGATPLQLAIDGDYVYRSNRDLRKQAMRNKWFLVGYLVARGADYDIWTAAAVGDAEQVEAFLQGEPSLANARNSVGKRPLSYAARFGHFEAVKLLLTYGADPNAEERDAPDGSALWAAVKGSHESCARLLLEHGANPNAVVESGGNPLFMAMRGGQERLVSLLYTYGASVSLDSACCLGRLDLVSEMLHANPSLVHTGGDYGPLCMAAGYGHTELVKRLLCSGANLNAPWYANNYMGYAIDAGLEMVRLLLEAGADPNNANWLGVTYLHKAAWKGDKGWAALLLEFGAELDAIDEEYGTTPLGWAAKFGQHEMVRYLLERGANPNAPKVQEWARPINWAKRRGHAAIAAMLE